MAGASPKKEQAGRHPARAKAAGIRSLQPRPARPSLPGHAPVPAPDPAPDPDPRKFTVRP